MKKEKHMVRVRALVEMDVVVKAKSKKEAKRIAGSPAHLISIGNIEVKAIEETGVANNNMGEEFCPIFECTLNYAET